MVKSFAYIINIDVENVQVTTFISGFDSPKTAFCKALESMTKLKETCKFCISDFGTIIDKTGKDTDFVTFPNPIQIVEVWEQSY